MIIRPASEPEKSHDTSPKTEALPPLFIELCQRKKIDASIFTPNAKEWKGDIDQHAAWVFKNIYSIPYPRVKAHKIARSFHGIQHVSRAAMYIPIFSNLYRRHGDEEASKLTPEDIYLLQIAMLFHDAAREDENEDRWDNESALFLYYYLINVVHVPHHKAKLLAEAIANKDADKKGFKKLIFNEMNEPSWQSSSERPKNIYEKLIHDADCLDILRARDYFDASHLDFYNQIASKNEVAFDEMAKLITEARSIIETQGDGRQRVRPDIKMRYEHEQAYSAVLQTIKSEHFKVLPQLFADGKLLPESELKKELLASHNARYDKTKGLTEENVQAALREGKVIARSISTPSAIYDKALVKREQYRGTYFFKLLADEKKEYPDETLAEVERRKWQRRPGVPTRTQKLDRNNKNGNPNRSCSLLGWGASVFGEAGYLLIDPDLNAIRKIADNDQDTGRWKKKVASWLESKSISPEENAKKLQMLLKKQKMGGSSDRKGGSYPLTHNEITYDVTDYHAVYFTLDPTFDNANHSGGSPYPKHQYAPVLQAIYLKKIYENGESKTIPLFEYSGIHDFIKLREYSVDMIHQMWVEMCVDFMKMQLSQQDQYFGTSILSMSLDDIKTLSMYGSRGNSVVKRHAPADSNYDMELKLRIDKSLEDEKSKLIIQYKESVLKELLEEKRSLLEPALFYKLFNNKEFLEHPLVREKMLTTIECEMKTQELFDKPESSGLLAVKHQGSGNGLSELLFPTGGPISFQSNLIAREMDSSAVLRLYAIAEWLDHEDGVRRIKEAAILVAKKKLDECSDTDNLKKIMCYVAQFNIYHEVKEEIDLKVYSLVQKASAVVKASNYGGDWQHYYYIISSLNEVALFDNGSLHEISETLKLLGAGLQKGSHSTRGLLDIEKSEIHFYSKIAAIANVPLAEQREVIIKFFVNSRISNEHTMREPRDWGYSQWDESTAEDKDAEFIREIESTLKLFNLNSLFNIRKEQKPESKKETITQWLKSFNGTDENDFNWVLKLVSPYLSDMSLFKLLVTRYCSSHNTDELQQQIAIIKEHLPNNEFSAEQTQYLKDRESYVRFSQQYEAEKEMREKQRDIENVAPAAAASNRGLFGRLVSVGVRQSDRLVRGRCVLM